MEGEGDRGYVYDGKFQGKVLIVRRTKCGKTPFIQKLGQQGLFEEEITDVFRVSLKEREALIRDSFERARSAL